MNKGVIRSYDFAEEFNRLLRDAESSSKVEASIPKKMKTFEQSKKSQKTVASMIVKGNDTNTKKNVKDKKNEQKQAKEGRSMHKICIFSQVKILYQQKH